MSGNIAEMSVKVNVDVSEAIRGLKAIQREAKKASQFLRELETEIARRYGGLRDSENVNPVYYASGLRDYATDDLRMEINYREAVELQAKMDSK